MSFNNEGKLNIKFGWMCWRGTGEKERKERRPCLVTSFTHPSAGCPSHCPRGGDPAPLCAPSLRAARSSGRGRDCGAPRWLRVGAEPGAGTGRRRALPGPPPHHGPAIGAPTPSRRAFLSFAPRPCAARSPWTATWTHLRPRGSATEDSASGGRAGPSLRASESPGTASW